MGELLYRDPTVYDRNGDEPVENSGAWRSEQHNCLCATDREHCRRLVSCNHTVHLSEQKGMILGQVKGSGTALVELVGVLSF